MKAEERKELETNVLADRVGKVVQKMKGGPSRRVVFWLVVLGTVAVGLFFCISAGKAKEGRAAERLAHPGLRPQHSARRSLPDLQATVQGHAKEKSGLAAQMDIAFLVLDEGLKSLRQDKLIEGLAGLANIEESLEELEGRAKDEPMLRGELAYHRAVTARSPCDPGFRRDRQNAEDHDRLIRKTNRAPSLKAPRSCSNASATISRTRLTATWPPSGWKRVTTRKRLCTSYG